MKDVSPKIYLYQRVVQAKLFIDSHFSEQIDLSNISNEACFSKYHFLRLFKSIYAYTPHQYLIRVRLDNAKKLLQKGCDVTDACYNVGFESVGSFSSLFKKYEKISPLQYKRHYELRRQQIKDKPLTFIPNCYAEHHGWKVNE